MPISTFVPYPCYNPYANIPINIGLNYTIRRNCPPQTVEELVIMPNEPDTAILEISQIFINMPKTSLLNMFSLEIKYVDTQGSESYLVAKRWWTDTTSNYTILISEIDDPTYAPNEKIITGTPLIARRLIFRILVNILPDTEYTFNIYLKGRQVRKIV